MTEQRFHIDYLSLAETLFRIAYYILESQAEAEDAVQEVYLKLWKSRDRLDDVLSPKAYCVRMLKNACIDRLRAARKMELPEELPERETADNQDDTIDSRTRLNKVLEAVKALPERHRKILLLRTVEGLSYDEITRRTGINYITCRVLLSQARSKLKSKT